MYERGEITEEEYGRLRTSVVGTNEAAPLLAGTPAAPGTPSDTPPAAPPAETPPQNPPPPA